ncbi:MAG TPA: GIY-YIG nuclease family protein [Rickettsia endosymbiont of Degeeriella rufa]|nr:GIY-YIG nuclease family protein [Rickettsia endosymbiont of Degeeriella rufa]
MYWVYILCYNRNGTLYIGVTNNILRRTYEHKQKIIKGFTTKYNVIKLIYTEEFTNIKEALAREKALKKWNRSWKIKLIEKINPKLEDLGKCISGFPPTRE